MKFWRRIVERIRERSAYTTVFETRFRVEDVLAILHARTTDDRSWLLRRFRFDFAGKVDTSGFVVYPARWTGANAARPRAEGAVEEVGGRRTRVTVRVSWTGSVFLSILFLVFSIPLGVSFLFIGQWPPFLFYAISYLVTAFRLFHIPGAARRLEQQLRKTLSAEYP